MINIGRKEAVFFAVVLLAFLVAGFGVAYGGTNPEVMGHTAGEIEGLVAGTSLPTDCGAGAVLKWDAGAWVCGTDNVGTGSGGTSLPTTCGDEAPLEWDDANNKWTCGTDDVGGSGSGDSSGVECEELTSSTTSGKYDDGGWTSVVVPDYCKDGRVCMIIFKVLTSSGVYESKIDFYSQEKAVDGKAHWEIVGSDGKEGTNGDDGKSYIVYYKDWGVELTDDLPVTEVSADKWSVKDSSGSRGLKLITCKLGNA